MTEQPTPPAPRAVARERMPWWLRWFSAVLRPWIRIARPAAAEGLDDAVAAGHPVVYVVERSGLSDALILQQATESAGLPSPYAALPTVPINRRLPVLALLRRSSLLGRPRPVTRSRTLGELLAWVRADESRNVMVVPVSIFVGRAPERDSGWFRVLFAEDWGVVGRFRRLFAILLNGRDTLVQFAAPIDLAAFAADEREVAPERTQRKLARVLRTHFARIRTAVIGPDLSHRRTVVANLLNTEPVRAAIAATASREDISLDKARRRARSYAMEIAADYSHPLVRSASFVLRGFWNKLYGGVQLNHFDQLRSAAPGHEVIYVPCHRSHIDYLLLSYMLYVNGLVPPHIASGVNLNLPVVGPILRRGGAFFLRRSFRGNPLYSTVFSEYVAQLFARGVALEYFIEGGRSRTGRLLTPRGGMLAMTIRSFLRESRRPVMFQPVYIGYEKLMEGRAYIGELSGKPKQKESLFALFRSFGVLRQRYGRVTLNFGTPVMLTPLLDEHAPQWRSQALDADERPKWLAAAVDVLAKQILVQINCAADVNPINLLALALLSSPKHAMAESDLLAQLELCKTLLQRLPYAERVTVTDMDAAEIVAYGEQMGWVRRIEHPLGDVLASEGEQGVLLSYFRNNVLHLFTAAAWIACCFLNNQRMTRASILNLGRLVYPFVQAELYLRWDEDEFVEQVRATLALMTELGLLHGSGDGRVISRGPGQSDATFQLRSIAHSLLQAFERYYIAIALLVKNGSGSLSSGELESLCYQVAQRQSLLHELNSPEFFDRSLFRGFIQQLRSRRVVWPDEDGKLCFDEALEVVARDAKVILSRKIRHGILKLAPQTPADEAAGDAEENAEAE